MVPVNQVILGGDPLLGSSIIGNSLDEQLQMIERYKQNLEVAKQLKQQTQVVQQPIAVQKLIWDDKVNCYRMRIMLKHILRFKVW